MLEVGRIDKSNSPTVMEGVNKDVEYKKGFEVDLLGTNGDLVRPKGSSYLLCSERAKNLIESMTPAVTGISFTKISEMLMS